MHSKFQTLITIEFKFYNTMKKHDCTRNEKFSQFSLAFYSHKGMDACKDEGYNLHKCYIYHPLVSI